MNLQEAMRKVASLRKLAERGGTPEEAATAAAKAQEIIDKYNISVEDVDFDANQAKLDAEPVTDFGYSDPLDQPKRTHYEDNWSVRLASAVADSNCCVMRWYRAAKEFSSIKIIGRPSDVQTVRYLYGFFKQQILNLRAEHCVGRSSAYKGQFAMGCVDAVIEKLRDSRNRTHAEKRAEVSGNAMALVKVNAAIAKIDKRRKDVDEFIEGQVHQRLASMFCCSVEAIRFFMRGQFEEAKKCFSSIEDWRDSKNAFKKYMTGGRGGFRGSAVADEGRAHGRREGQSIRVTNSKAALGSGRKEIA